MNNFELEVLSVLKNMQTDISGIKSDIIMIKEDISIMKEDLNITRTATNYNGERLDELIEDLKKIDVI